MQLTQLLQLQQLLTGVGGATTTVAAADSVATEWSQYIVQAGYRFGGTTLVSANYAELTDDNATTGAK